MFNNQYIHDFEKYNTIFNNIKNGIRVNNFEIEQSKLYITADKNKKLFVPKTVSELEDRLIFYHISNRKHKKAYEMTKDAARGLYTDDNDANIKLYISKCEDNGCKKYLNINKEKAIYDIDDEATLEKPDYYFNQHLQYLKYLKSNNIHSCKLIVLNQYTGVSLCFDKYNRHTPIVNATREGIINGNTLDYYLSTKLEENKNYKIVGLSSHTYNQLFKYKNTYDYNDENLNEMLQKCDCIIFPLVYADHISILAIMIGGSENKKKIKYFLKFDQRKEQSIQPHSFSYSQNNHCKCQSCTIPATSKYANHIYNSSVCFDLIYDVFTSKISRNNTDIKSNKNVYHVHNIEANFNADPGIYCLEAINFFFSCYEEVTELKNWVGLNELLLPYLTRTKSYQMDSNNLLELSEQIKSSCTAFEEQRSLIMKRILPPFFGIDEKMRGQGFETNCYIELHISIKCNKKKYIVSKYIYKQIFIVCSNKMAQYINYFNDVNLLSVPIIVLDKDFLNNESDIIFFSIENDKLLKKTISSSSNSTNNDIFIKENDLTYIKPNVYLNFILNRKREDAANVIDELNYYDCFSTSKKSSLDGQKQFALKSIKACAKEYLRECDGDDKNILIDSNYAGERKNVFLNIKKEEKKESNNLNIVLNIKKQNNRIDTDGFSTFVDKNQPRSILMTQFKNLNALQMEYVYLNIKSKSSSTSKTSLKVKQEKPNNDDDNHDKKDFFSDNDHNDYHSTTRDFPYRDEDSGYETDENMDEYSQPGNDNQIESDAESSNTAIYLRNKSNKERHNINDNIINKNQANINYFLDRLREQNQTLKEYNQSKDDEINSQNNKIKQLNDQISTLRNNVDTLNNEKRQIIDNHKQDRLKEEYQTLKENNQRKDEEINSQNFKIKQLNNQISVLKIDIDTLNKEKENMKDNADKMMDQIRNNIQKIEEFESINSSLNNDIRNKNQYIEELKSNNNTSFSDYKTRLDSQYDIEIGQMKQTLNGAMENYKQMEENNKKQLIEQNQSKLQQNEEEKKEIIQQKDNIINALENRIKQLSKDIETLSKNDISEEQKIKILNNEKLIEEIRSANDFLVNQNYSLKLSNNKICADGFLLEKELEFQVERNRILEDTLNKYYDCRVRNVDSSSSKLIEENNKLTQRNLQLQTSLSNALENAYSFGSCSNSIIDSMSQIIENKQFKKLLDYSQHSELIRNYNDKLLDLVNRFNTISPGNNLMITFGEIKKRKFSSIDDKIMNVDEPTSSFTTPLLQNPSSNSTKPIILPSPKRSPVHIPTPLQLTNLTQPEIPPANISSDLIVPEKRTKIMKSTNGEKYFFNVDNNTNAYIFKAPIDKMTKTTFDNGALLSKYEDHFKRLSKNNNAPTMDFCKMALGFIESSPEKTIHCSMCRCGATTNIKTCLKYNCTSTSCANCFNKIEIEQAEVFKKTGYCMSCVSKSLDNKQCIVCDTRSKVSKQEKYYSCAPCKRYTSNINENQ